MNPHLKSTTWNGRVYITGDSHVVVIPKSVREYIGIEDGDTIEIKVMKHECKGKKK